MGESAGETGGYVGRGGERKGKEKVGPVIEMKERYEGR
jgi:hypothetical protein